MALVDKIFLGVCFGWSCLYFGSILLALFALCFRPLRTRAKSYLRNVILLGKKIGLKLLFLCFGVGAIVLPVFGLMVWAIGGEESGTPNSVNYHTAADLERATGIAFPEVCLVDSSYYLSFSLDQVSEKFVFAECPSESLFAQLDNACKTDSCCWSKDSLGYHYYILPEKPLDRTKGSHYRTVEGYDGSVVPDHDGDFVEVFIPYSADTLYLLEGWAR